MRALVDRHGTGRVMFRNRRAVVGGFPRRVPQIDVLPAVADEARRAVLIEEFLGDVAQPPFSPALDYAGDARIDWLVGLIEATGSDKVLLICRTQAKLHALDEALRVRSGVAVSRFHEGLGIVQRDRAAAHFAAADGARLMLCTEIGSEGRNFQFAHHLVLWDLPPDPDLLEQRIGRLDRIGQRHDVRIHLAVHAGSAQAALVRWYDEGLDAFRTSPEDGRTLYREYGARVIDAALADARGTPDAPAQLDLLIEETRARHQELAEALARGRDRLLELNTRLDEGAERLRAALSAADADLDARDFQVRLFEAYGVDVDEQGSGLVLLDPEMMTTAAFPGLDEPRLATFERATALAREDVLFLRPDHPMLAGALDLLLSAETGNAAFLVDDALPPRSALLEAVFVPDCVAPPALVVERFLPALPERIVVDTRLGEVQDYMPDAASVRRAAERTVEVPRYSRLLRTLVPPMLATAERRAEERLADAVARAVVQARGAVGTEIARLENLRRVNPSVQQREVDAARDELAALEEVLPQARPRIDALRFVVSADFLNLRG
jgi:ATP-dependent helicase HepA